MRWLLRQAAGALEWWRLAFLFGVSCLVIMMFYDDRYDAGDVMAVVKVGIVNTDRQNRRRDNR